MPKEIVYGNSLPYSENDPARSIAEVSWSREAEHVQVVTKCVRAEDTEQVYENSELPTLKAADGWYIYLDRSGINRLIRNLRRARDQAFGRDE